MYRTKHRMLSLHLCLVMLLPLFPAAVMEKYERYVADDFYTDILESSAAPFCPSCESALSTLIPTKFYHGNIYGE